MNLSRKRRKELHQLQKSANQLWHDQQHLAENAAVIAREAGRQIGNFNRETLVPTVQNAYESNVVPVVDRGVKASKKFVEGTVVPAVGGVVGTALSAWDHATDTRTRLSGPAGKYVQHLVEVAEPKKKGIGAGGVIAIILGAAAAIGVLYAAWQTLRADDELWVADDPLSAPEA
ncbi:hypothetical protein [Microbacterium gorillae]|uniref:hypothetical protein n=1 Tax=Microbacterium gorillae TaxID=1231063 RepID=UPI00058D243A|nr:hypothetical protein [Microbacterium gorillae]